MKTIITERVNDKLEFKLQQYERVAQGFSKFFSQDELFRVLDNVVDQKALLKVSQTKASKKEFKQAMSIIESLYQRLRQLSIMQVETSRVLVPGKTSSSMKAAEAINSKLARRDYLLKQSLITANWVQDFKKNWNQEMVANMNESGVSPLYNQDEFTTPGHQGRVNKQAVSIPFALNQARQSKGASSLANSSREQMESNNFYETKHIDGYDESIGQANYGVNSMPTEIQEF